MIDKRIAPLAIGGLAIGTTEFAIMGLLPDLAATFHVSIPKAATLISAYALGVVIGAPILIGYSLRFPPKRVLSILMVLFVLFNGLSIVAPSYELMLPIRFLAGLPHGAFFGVGTVVATTLAEKGKEARSIAVMFGGLTFANLAMVPFVTYIGHLYHWRWYFVVVTLIGALTLLAIRWWIPKLEAKKQGSIKAELAFMKRRETWFVLLITAIGFGGLFAWFSYISPLMLFVSKVEASKMAYIMMLAGGGMFVGNYLGGVLTDKLGAANTATCMLLLMTVALVGIFFYSDITYISIALAFICGGLAMSIAAPLNIMIIKAAPGSEMMAAAFNVANSAGAFLGGIPLKYGYDYTYPSLIGAIMALVGLVITIGYSFAGFKRAV